MDAEKPMLKGDAELFLMKGYGLKRNEARTLIQSDGTGHWRLKKMVHLPGQPVILLPCIENTRTSDVTHSEEVAAETTASETPRKQTSETTGDSADRMNTGPRNPDSRGPASDVGIPRRTRFSPPGPDKSGYMHTETAADVDADELQDMDL
jgi:hypothetical protein